MDKMTTLVKVGYKGLGGKQRRWQEGKKEVRKGKS